MCFSCKATVALVSNRDIHDYIDIYLDPVIVIITFLLGYIISNLITNKKEKMKLNKVYNYFNLYYKNQLNSIEKQIELIKEHKIKLEQVKDTSGVNIVMISQPYFILDSINKEDLFSAWSDIQKKDSESIISILTFIEFTKISFQGYLEYHKGFLLRQDVIRGKWNLVMKEFHLTKADLMKVPVEVIISNPDLIKLNEIYNEWSDLDNTSFKEVIVNLVEPIIKYYTPIYSSDPDNHIALILLTRAQEIRIVYTEWDNDIKSYIAYINSLILELDTQTELK